MKNKTKRHEREAARAIKMASVFIAAIFFFNSTLFAFEAMDTTFSGGFSVRQEIQKTGHLLISKPSSADARIVDIIAKNNIKSLSEYTDWLGKNVKYKTDGALDEWLSSDQTLNRKYGDCEDYAFLNAAVLKVLGYNPQVLAVMGRTKSHAVCVFKKNGKYMWFDNATLRSTDVFSIAQFAEYIFSTYKASLISEMNPVTKTHTILYVRTM